MEKKEIIVVVDFGAQYAQLIALILRKCGVFSVIVPYSKGISAILEYNPIGIILSGGPESVLMNNAPTIDPKIYSLGIPIMGICYGHQLMAKQLGGVVWKSDREYGRCRVNTLDESERKGTPITGSYVKRVWMSHEDSVVDPPSGFRVIATSERCPIAAMMDSKRKFLSFQFHPEVEHTDDGKAMIDFFVHDMCGATGDWKMADFVESAIGKIRKEVYGGRHVIGALSGGVDSSTVTLLMSKAIEDRYTAIFVNNGLLRKGEAEQVAIALALMEINFRYVDASSRFLSALQGITDPDEKRKIIGNIFIEVFEEEARKIGEEKGIKIDFLTQGTLYPDVIESVSAHGGPTAKIKRHHNVGGLPEKMGLKLIEPFRELFKDEVRRIGKGLGLPDEIVWRHPFPGPGLAIRCMGEVTEERLEILRRVDEIFIRELHANDLYYKIGQAFAVLTDMKTVGVQGDAGTYKWVVAIRSVDTSVYMTADVTRFDWNLLLHISNSITNEVPEIGRVVYDITSKPPGTIEWE